MSTHHDDDVVICSAVRTPIGKFMGALSGVASTALGAAAIRAAVAQAQARPDQIGEVLMGCVLSANLGQAPARQATLGAGLPAATPATTVNKVCGSGLKSVMLATDGLRLDGARVVVAGGMESMSRAPYLVPNARSGYKVGHAAFVDHLMMDGLEDAYDKGRSMGTFGEDTAKAYGFTRAQQDAYALETVRRAQDAIAQRHFAVETIPVKVGEGVNAPTVTVDEIPGKISPDKIPGLRPAFRADGTITAASASANSDGAAALVLSTRGHASRLGLPVLARVVAHATHARAPAEFTLAPIGAVQKVLARAGWTVADVDLFEINEAFAVVVMAAMRDLGLSHDRVNVHGGACALGHPIGASGARVLVTLLHALLARRLHRGVATLCIGGGEAVALAVELTT
jgi:acetyl-CoA C-acetyltransferase